jgi:hypothetical protein
MRQAGKRLLVLCTVTPSSLVVVLAAASLSGVLIYSSFSLVLTNLNPGGCIGSIAFYKNLTFLFFS